MRAITGSTAFIFYVASFRLIPLVLVTVLEGLCPFWAILIGWIVLGLKFSALEWIALCIRFVAIILIYFSAQDQQ